MADFSHIQAVQTVVGEVFILIIIVQNILRDKTFITEHFKKGTYHRLDKASRCSNSEWLAARNFWQSLAQVRLFYWSPFFVTCQSTHFLFVFVFNHLPNCASIFFNHVPKYALLFVFVDNHLPKSAFFIGLSFFFTCPSMRFHTRFCFFVCPCTDFLFASAFYSPAQVRSFYLPSTVCYSLAQVPVASPHIQRGIWQQAWPRPRTWRTWSMATADWSISLRRRYGAGKVRNILFRKSFWFLTALAHSLHCCTLPTNTNNVTIITLHSCLICNDAFKGTGHATKSVEFSEKYQTASTPPHFQKIVLQFFFQKRPKKGPL